MTFRKVIALAAAFCAAAALFAAEPAARPIRLVTHRGESGDAPENTVPAFELAWKRGAAWAVETDVRVTSDGELVCCHDASAERTGGADLPIAKTTFAELRKLDFGKWKGEKFAGTPIPTLTEALQTLPPHGHIFIELKTGVNDNFARKFAAAVHSSGVKPEQVTFISFSRNLLKAVYKFFPAYRRLWIVSIKPGTGQPETAEEIVKILKEDGLTGADMAAPWKIRMDYFSEAFIQTFHDAGFEAHFWTFDLPEQAKVLFDRGADSVTTNRSQRVMDGIRKLSGK